MSTFIANAQLALENSKWHVIDANGQVQATAEEMVLMGYSNTPNLKLLVFIKVY